ncbi:Unknown protein, partial [Striga hermonthica]
PTNSGPIRLSSDGPNNYVSVYNTTTMCPITILPRRIHRLLKNGLYLLVARFCFARGLWMVWGGQLMRNAVLLHQFLKNSVAEMFAPIAHNGT